MKKAGRLLHLPASRLLLICDMLPIHFCLPFSLPLWRLCNGSSLRSDDPIHHVGFSQGQTNSRQGLQLVACPSTADKPSPLFSFERPVSFCIGFPSSFIPFVKLGNLDLILEHSLRNLQHPFRALLSSPHYPRI